MYYPELGRLMTIDPLAEMNPELTGYRYGFNNPTRYTDFMRLWETDKNGNHTTDRKEDIERFMTYLQAQSANGSITTTGEIDRFISFENSGVEILIV